MSNTKLKLIPSPSIHTSPYHVYLQSLSPSGRRSMASLLNTCTSLIGFSGHAGDFDWSSFTYAKAMMIRSAMVQADYAINTINMAISALKGVMKTAFHLELIDADQLGRVNALKSVRGNIQKRPGRILSQREIKTLLNACEEYSYLVHKRNKALLLLALNTGLRCSELCALTTEDIDLRTKQLLVTKGKGRKQRVVYLNKQAATSLNDWLAIRGNTPGPLFVRVHKGSPLSTAPLTTNGIAHIFRELSTRANVRAFSPHDLRRTFITQLLEENIDLNTVRLAAGHSDISTTIRYDKRNERSHQSKLSRLSFG